MMATAQTWLKLLVVGPGQGPGDAERERLALMEALKHHTHVLALSAYMCTGSHARAGNGSPHALLLLVPNAKLGPALASLLQCSLQL